MNKSRAILISFISGIILFGGCGGDNPGQGSGTLKVEAEIEATNRTPNADSPSSFDTGIDVTVTKDGNGVSDASVFVETDRGRIELTEGNSGEYSGSQGGYAQVFDLSIEAGDDFLSGVRLTGPDIHVFNQPTQGSQVTAGTALDVQWNQSGADQARISFADLSRTTIADSGEYRIPGQYLEASGGDVEEETIRLERMNVLTPNGTTTGSEVRVVVRNTLDIMVLGE